MTTEQKRLVEDNHNLIYFYLNRHNISVDEYYDVAAIGLVKAALNYNNSKSTFSTFAVLCIGNEIKNVYKKNGACGSIPYGLVFSYQDKVSDEEENMTFESILEDNSDMEEEMLARLSLERFMKRLDERRIKIVKLSLLGYSSSEISRILGVSQQRIGQIRSMMLEEFKGKYL